MHLAGKAYNFIAAAAKALAPADRQRLATWLTSNPNGAAAPPNIVALSIRALQGLEAQYLDRREKARGDDDAESDLIMDISFIQAAIRSLSREASKVPA